MRSFSNLKHIPLSLTSKGRILGYFTLGTVQLRSIQKKNDPEYKGLFELARGFFNPSRIVEFLKKPRQK